VAGLITIGFPNTRETAPNRIPSGKAEIPFG